MGKGSNAVGSSRAKPSSKTEASKLRAASASSEPATTVDLQLLRAFLKEGGGVTASEHAPEEVQALLRECESESEARYLLKNIVYNMDANVPLFLRLDGMIELQMLASKPSLASLMELVDEPGRSHARVIKLMEKASALPEASIAALASDQKRLAEFEKMMSNRDDFTKGRGMR